MNKGGGPGDGGIAVGPAVSVKPCLPAVERSVPQCTQQAACYWALIGPNGSEDWTPG